MKYELCFFHALSMFCLVLTGCMVPQMAMTSRERGDSFLSHRHYDAAVYHYTRAIEADSRDVDALNGRAMALSRQIDIGETTADKRGADLPAALADYDRAVAITPSVPQIHINRGIVRAANGN